MPILTGKRLGPYEILSAIGAGGMGEVYRAKDTRLNRIVAIKVLPSHLADSPELRERFEREARTIASLNHPHICTLYDIGHQDGTDYLVMEYLEGETLAERLVKGPLPLEQVLQYAIEIADALDKAHRKGVTHRDLKPGNIMLTKSGTKLLDFGLAKLKQEVAPAATPFSQMPTLSQNPTVEGTILGTLQYMAPEQVEGRVEEIDGRTDIFAFGAVLYEMATGKKAFTGRSTASLMGAIMNLDPPLISSLQPMTPPALDRVVKKCLAKEPDERWQTASDLRGELKWIAESGAQAAPPPAAPAKDASALRRRSFLLSGAALLLGAITAGLAIWNVKPSAGPIARPVTRTVIALPPGDRLVGPDQPALALSPDGKYLAYAAIRRSTQQIYLRPLDSSEARPVPGTEGAVAPAFSPDGQWLGFFSGGKLKKVSANGGAAVTLADALSGYGLTWSSHGTIVFQPTVGPLLEISEAGGEVHPATRLENGEPYHAWPEFLPDGRTLLFNSPLKISVQNGPGQHRDLVQGASLRGPARYAPSGHLLYVQAGNLMAAPFDAQRMEIKGAAVPVIEGVAESIGTAASQWSISATGSLVYLSGGTATTQQRMVWVSRNGTEQLLPTPAQTWGYPRLSPDARSIANTIGLTAEQDVWVYDIMRDTLTRLTFQANSGGNAANPIWTPDGKRLVFRALTDKGSKLFWQPADGSGPAEELTSGTRLDANSFSPDGQLLAFTNGGDIWVLHLSDRKAQPFLKTPANELGPRFSPDGHWLAYVCDESGRNEIYVQPYPGPGGKWQLSTEGGNEPVWNPNERELFYRNADKMMAVDITTQPAFSAGKPKMVFAGHYRPTGIAHPNYDVLPDGQRFLMVKDVEEAPAITQINLVQNWFEELKQKVPVGMKR